MDLSPFESHRLPALPDLQAPDGSDVRVLLRLAGGSMAHFTLAPGATSRAIVHRTVEELWYCLSGGGQMWREQAGHAEIVELSPGLCLSIPAGTRFQFRCDSAEPFSAVGVTMPPWPGEDEAVFVDGPWAATATRT